LWHGFSGGLKQQIPGLGHTAADDVPADIQDHGHPGNRDTQRLTSSPHDPLGQPVSLLGPMRDLLTRDRLFVSDAEF
jgi:hypothetical protein